MTDARSTLERELDRLTPTRISFGDLADRRDRKRRDERIRAGVVGLAVAIAVAWLGIHAIGSTHVPAGHPTPSPAGTHDVARRAGETLRSTFEGPGDLVAVDPSGATRVIVERRYVSRVIHSAAWSSDGRWVAYDMAFGGELWIAGSGVEPRRVASGIRNWAWSPAGPQLAAIRGSTLIAVDASTGVTAPLARIVGDVTSDPVWSPDGTRILFGARGGSLYSVDVLNRARSLVVRLPGDRLDSVDQIAWSPDGERIAVMNDLEPGGGRLYVLDQDGSDVRVVADDYEPMGLTWSPDGSRLAYAESRTHVQDELRVWVVPADGSASSLVWSHAPGGWRGRDEGAPVWSPSGSEIAFAVDRGYLRIDADGTGAAIPMDASLYERWKHDGSYVCGCFG